MQAHCRVPVPGWSKGPAPLSVPRYYPLQLVSAGTDGQTPAPSAALLQSLVCRHPKHHTVVDHVCLQVAHQHPLDSQTESVWFLAWLLPSSDFSLQWHAGVCDYLLPAKSLAGANGSTVALHESAAVCIGMHGCIHPVGPVLGAHASFISFSTHTNSWLFLRPGTLEWLAVNLARCWVSSFPTFWPVCDLHWGAEHTPKNYEWWLLTGHRHTSFINTGKMAGWRW